jgi:hypothetical protein
MAVSNAADRAKVFALNQQRMSRVRAQMANKTFTPARVSGGKKGTGSPTSYGPGDQYGPLAVMR